MTESPIGIEVVVEEDIEYATIIKQQKPNQI